MATDLIARIAAGEAEAEKELIARYSKGVYFILRRMLGFRGAMGEAHADTFRQAIAKIRSGEFTDPEQLSAFIAALARFRGETSREPWPPAESFSAVIRERNAALVRELLSQFGSAVERQVLFQFYVSGNELDSIAGKAGLTPDKCSRIVAEAREKFAPLFERRVEVVLEKA